MSEIKRVLWIDDYVTDSVKKMFVEEETKRVTSMDEAIQEIAGEHLYDYDTIVLDIDFENGLEDADAVIEELSKKIFLNEEQKNKNFVISNGGYLLFLYLLEKGYPSEQVAFLTGNAGIISQLQEYNSQNAKKLSKDEIVEAFIKGWEETNGAMLAFLKYVDGLALPKPYADSDVVISCAKHMAGKEFDKLRDVIYEIKEEKAAEKIQNTTDKMIFRFHEANLESPIYFSKNVNDIAGHNSGDAKLWLQEKRTFDRVTRWLLLAMGDYIEDLFDDDESKMNQQVATIFKDINGDGGIRSAFRQMYYVFDGLRIKHRGAYYQAMAAMLIPFEAKVNSEGFRASGANEDRLRMMFARCAKQARNYCAHNYFGSSISNETTLFLLMITTSALLTKQQRHEMSDWYQRTRDLFHTSDMTVSDASNRQKIDRLMQYLHTNGDFDLTKVTLDIQNYSARDCVVALGYNEKMQTKTEQDDTVRESYFAFALAAYIVQWFDGMRREEIERRFGEEVLCVYDVAERLVADYQYPAGK